MAVPEQWQIEIVLDGIRSTIGAQLSREDASAKSCCHLDVAERRRMEVGVGGPQNFLDLARALRPQEIVDQCRSVDDDDPQEASLAVRSRLMSSAADSPRSTRGRRAIRSKTSWGAGRATSRSRIRSTYSVRVSPLARARLVNSRCSLSGTFRTWIILDMRTASHMCSTCAIGWQFSVRNFRDLGRAP
jgi:hypothetical protein